LGFIGHGGYDSPPSPRFQGLVRNAWPSSGLPHADSSFRHPPKGILVASAPFQRGALDFARAHGIALARFIDGALLYGVKSKDGDIRRLVPLGGRGLALLRVQGTDAGWQNTTLTNQPDYFREMFPGFDSRSDQLQQK
jgi:hypothetical protein